MKKFDDWNQAKQFTEKRKKRPFFKERDVFFMKFGKNIGFEEDGKGGEFLRPGVILRKFNDQIALVVPLSTTEKEGFYYFKVILNNRKNKVLLSQIRLLDSKRFKNKLCTMSRNEFDVMKEKIGKMLRILK